MALRYYANGPATELNGGIDGSQTTLAVAAGGANQFPATFPYTIIVDYGEPTEEVMDVTNRVSDTLTVTRGADTSTTFPHSSGAVVVHGVSARDHREANTHINASSGVHGRTGSLVGTTDAQTLTNKILGAGTELTNGEINDSVMTGTTIEGGILRDEVTIEPNSANALEPVLIKNTSGTQVGFVDRSGVIQGQRLRAINLDAASIPLVVRTASGQTGLAVTVLDSDSGSLFQVGAGGRTGIGDTASDTAGLRVRARNTDDVTIQSWRKTGQVGYLYQAITETGGNLASIDVDGVVQGTKLRVTDPSTNINDANPGILVGSSSSGQANIVIDADEIHARTGTTTGGTTLWLNRHGGTVNIAADGGGNVQVPGNGQFKIASRALSIRSTEPTVKSAGDVWISTQPGGVSIWHWTGSAWVGGAV